MPGVGPDSTGAANRRTSRRAGTSLIYTRARNGSARSGASGASGSGEKLGVERGDARRDQRPAVVSMAVAVGAGTPSPPLLRVRGSGDERVRERVLVVGWDEPAGAGGDDLRRSGRLGGDHRQPAGHGLDEHEPKGLGDRGQNEQVGGVQRLWEQLVRPPAGEEDLVVPERAGGGERMLPLPFAGVAADEDERQRPAEPLERPRVRHDEKRQPLDGGVAAHIEENRLSFAEGPEIRLPVGDGAGSAALVPTQRLLDEPAPPVEKALLGAERSPLEQLELDPARERLDALERDADQSRDLHRRARRDDQALAGLRPAALARRPAAGEAPAGRRAGLVRAQQRKLGAVQLPEHGHGWKGPQRSLVRRCQVVEVKDVRARRPRPSEGLAPGGDEPLVGLVVDGREDAIRSARPVLVGGLEGNDRRGRVGQPPGRRVVDRYDVDPGEEARRMTLLTGASERTGGERHLPAEGGQNTAEGPSDLRRAAAREEEERRDDATTGTPHRRAAASPLVWACTRVRHRDQFSPGRARPGLVAARSILCVFVRRNERVCLARRRRELQWGAERVARVPSIGRSPVLRAARAGPLVPGDTDRGPAGEHRA